MGKPAQRQPFGRRPRRRRALLAGLMILAAAGWLGRPLLDLARHFVAPAFAEDGNGGGDGGGEGGDNGGGEGGGSGGDQGGDGGENGGNGSQKAGSESGSPPATHADTGIGGRHGDFAAGEVVVVGDRPEILATAEGLGFRLIDDR